MGALVSIAVSRFHLQTTRTMATTEEMNSFSVPGIICGYHVYQRIWTPFVGEKATTAREPGNQHDPYVVAVLEDQTLCTVGHLPREISKACSFFIRRNGVIDVEVTGPRQKSAIPDMGMKIPCLLSFTHTDPHLLQNAEKLVKSKTIQDRPPEPRRDLKDNPERIKDSKDTAKRKEISESKNAKPKKRKKESPAIS